MSKNLPSTVRMDDLVDRSWAPNPLLALHREMNRLFDDVFAGASPAPGAANLSPRVNVEETEKELRVTAELPGVEEKDIQLTLDDDLITIRGEKKLEMEHEQKDFHVVERAYGVFQRAIRLPFRAEPDEVKARFENGVLTVSVPKTPAQESARRVRIDGPSGKSKGQDAQSKEAQGRDAQGRDAQGQEAQGREARSNNTQGGQALA
jgi:HSP20 family protein